MIDINFDFREDSICGDPDSDSPILYQNLALIWNTTPLPKNKKFNLKPINLGGRIVLKNDLFNNLSSDRMCPHFDGKYKIELNDWATDIEKEDFKAKVRTIGGHIIFPAHKNNGFTINQARGINKKICDRFDLTLECIRKFYIGETNPLSNALTNYIDFFNIFEDFKTYIDFFLLQDFVDENYMINFSIPFDNFVRSPLPQSKKEYQDYKSNIIKSIDKRNKRILNLITTFH